MGSAIAFKAAKAEDSLDSVNFPDQDGPTVLASTQPRVCVGTSMTTGDISVRRNCYNAYRLLYSLVTGVSCPKMCYLNVRYFRPSLRPRYQSFRYNRIIDVLRSSVPCHL